MNCGPHEEAISCGGGALVLGEILKCFRKNNENGQFYVVFRDLRLFLLFHGSRIRNLQNIRFFIVTRLVEDTLNLKNEYWLQKLLLWDLCFSDFVNNFWILNVQIFIMTTYVALLPNLTQCYLIDIRFTNLQFYINSYRKIEWKFLKFSRTNKTA